MREFCGLPGLSFGSPGLRDTSLLAGSLNKLRYQDLPDGLSISMKCRLDYQRRAYGVVHTNEI